MRRATSGGVRRGARSMFWCAVALVVFGAGQAESQSVRAPSTRQTALPAGFVYLRDVAPSIEQDMRYAGYDNFVGRPLPGYDAPECVLRRDVAEALKQVQADLAAENLSLKVYDCYRPTRAVRAMAQWAFDGRDTGSTKRYYPKLQKQNLFALGYISN
ncbi:MAG: M15 family metallopeptidase, partial [Xanthobacteraceae bacterium]